MRKIRSSSPFAQILPASLLSAVMISSLVGVSVYSSSASALSVQTSNATVSSTASTLSNFANVPVLPFAPQANTENMPLGQAAGDAAAAPNPSIVGAAPKNCVKPKGKLPGWNFEKANLLDVLRQISKITCKNFIVSEAVKGKGDITIISQSAVDADQAYAAFLSVLEANNMALVPAGKYLKVVERKDSAKQSLPVYSKAGNVPDSDAQVTLLYELKYANRDQTQQLIRNLLGKSSDLQVAGADLLIITDSGSNIRRVTGILDKIDVPGSLNRIHVIDVQYAEAQAVQQKLNEIFGGNAGAGKAAVAPKANGKKKGDTAPASPDGAANPANATAGIENDSVDNVQFERIVADDRTNKLFVVASQNAFTRIQEVVSLLDIPSEGAAGSQIFVYPLNNSDAQKTATTLSTLAQGSSQKKANKAGTGKPGEATTPSAPAAQGGDAAVLFEGEIKVTADEATNSLVIVSSPRDFKALKRVIEDLDVRRPQVYVEAVIMEVAMTERREFDMNFYTPLPSIAGGVGLLANQGGQQLVVSAAQTLTAQQLFQDAGNLNLINSNPLSLANDAVSGLSNLLGILSFQGPALAGNPFGFAVPSFGFVLNVLQNNANVNVLSTPHLITIDNEKAEISVGQRVPVVRGVNNGAASALGGLGGLGSVNVSYEDVKLKLVITPHVNSEDDVRMEIEQEISDLGNNIPVGENLTQPVINSRNLKSTVIMHDQQTIVLGGLIQERKSDSESKVPILGDIPVVGWLFKNWWQTHDRNNLLLVFTPYIVRENNDFQKIYDRKMHERQEFLESYYGASEDYAPYIDYDRKVGPMGGMLQRIKYEEQKAENGGPGLPGEVIIEPGTITSKSSNNAPHLDDRADAGTDGGVIDGNNEDAVGNPNSNKDDEN